MKFFYQDSTGRFQLQAETPEDFFRVGWLSMLLKGPETSVTNHAGNLVLSGRIEDLLTAAETALQELKDRVASLDGLLKRVSHHGPTGSWVSAGGQCWPDCVACEYEKLSAFSERRRC